MSESFPEGSRREEIPDHVAQEERLAAIVADHNRQLRNSALAIKASLTLPEDAFVAVQNGRYTIQVARQADVKPPFEAALDGDKPERAPLIQLGLLYRMAAKNTEQSPAESYFVPVAQGFGDFFEPVSNQGTVGFLRSDVGQVASMITDLDHARGNGLIPSLDDTCTRIVNPPAAS